VPEHAASTADLLVRADLAMYRAKLRGQAFAVYAEQVDGEGNRLGLVEELRVAIDQRSLELHYQPQIDMTTGEIVAVEALVRWPHARLGLVPPLEFLPLAEDAGLMDPLTAMILDEALSQCAIWRITGRQVAVSVNVSATNLLDPGFPALVQQLLDDHGLPPGLLVIEVTETTAMADVHRCKRAIQSLSDLGLVVSVDDFGAGFTSLAYLSTLAVGELKLDRSFIDGLARGTDGRNRALVGSTINLAHSLGLRVVAEGVEDEESLELLADLECNLAQGYLISRPVPAGELTLERLPRAA
jgi:EAL domain-containing protein (putative c-di-GMP-specific phosphodiesterase class I)